MKHNYVSETGQKIACIRIKEEEHQTKDGKKYFLHHLTILGDTEDEVIDTIISLRKKLKKVEK